MGTNPRLMNVPVNSRRSPQQAFAKEKFRMYLVPCSCGTSFSVSEDYDRKGTSWSRYLICPHCGKPHDPKNRLLELRYQPQGYWQVETC